MTISAARPDPASPIHTYVMGSATTFMVTSIREYPITVSALFVYTASKTMGSVRPVGVPSRIRRSRVMMRDCVGWTSVKDQFSTKGSGFAASTVDEYVTSEKCALFEFTCACKLSTAPPCSWHVNWYFSVSPTRDSDAGA